MSTLTISERLGEALERVHALQAENDAHAQEIERLKGRVAELDAEMYARREGRWQEMLEWRGVETPCQRCSGAGVRAYGSSAAWTGGIGGQAITNGICDQCWGSGESTRPWLNLKTRANRETELSARRQRCEELTTDVADLNAYRGAVRKALSDTLARCERLETALKDCAKTFREYEEMHRAKGTQEGRAKAFANGVMADRCEKALAGEQPEGKPGPGVDLKSAFEEGYEQGHRDGGNSVANFQCGAGNTSIAQARRERECAWNDSDARAAMEANP